MNNKLLLLIALLCLSAWAHAQDTKAIQAPIKEATVFLQGAELTHQASIALKQGANELTINNLSPLVDKKSIRIKTTKGVIVSSFEYEVEHELAENWKKKAKLLEDTIKLYEREIRGYDIDKRTNEDLLDLLEDGRKLATSQEKLDVAEFTKIVDYYGTKANELRKDQRRIAEKKDEIQAKIVRLERELSREETKNAKQIGTLRLNLSSPLSTTAQITVLYYTRNASWTPYYDVNIPVDGKSISFAGKATVEQTTGLDWGNVRLTLSASLPSNAKEAPLFKAWFLDFRSNLAIAAERVNSSQLSGSVPGINVMQNSYTGASDIRIRGTGKLKEAAEPMYIINGEIASAEEVASISPDMIANMSVLKDANSTSIYGSRAANGVILITTKTAEDMVSSDENELTTVYNIDMPYTIAGNGKEQTIALKTYVVDATFKHYAVPRLDKEVFLLAEIADWQKLAVMSGKANITYDNTYIGSTVIDASSVSKKLTLTLGVDKRVIVKRQLLKDFSSKKWMGKDVKQEFTYKITVKNNQNKPINLLVKDQYPISKQKEIDVELLKTTTEATGVNEEVGVLNWDMELNAGESKEVRMSFSVKYPKDKPINLY